MLGCATLAFTWTVDVAAQAADMPPLAFKAPSAAPASYDWTGFYLGGHLGDAWGSSRWTASSPGAPTIAGSLNLFQPFDPFAETGSFFEGVQAGYDYMLANRFVLGAAVDASFPAFPDLAGISVGGSSTFLRRHWRRKLWRDGAVLRHRARSRRLCARGLARLCDRRIRLDLRPGVLTQLGNGATDRASCGDLVGRPEPASRSRSRRTGRRRSNICSPTMAPQRHLSQRRAAVRCRFLPARIARGGELSVRRRCGSGEFRA